MKKNQKAQKGLMKKIIIIVIILGMGLYGNQKFRTHKQELLANASETTTDYASRSAPDAPPYNTRFKGDGRTYCSQMTSCEEATFF
jgi:hypothetical protein